jgi:4-hydroxy-3-methylbut-2-enyl diphosphate reductase
VEIIAAKTAGFCFGVSKAVNTIFDILGNTNDRIYTLGPIIHNEDVVEDLKKKGVKVIDDAERLEGPGNVVIRAHGVAPDVYDKLNQKKMKITDATCPYVKKIHHLVAEKQKQGWDIIIVGDREHPEVKGINGWCGNVAYIVDKVEDIDAIPDNGRDFCVVSQTTLNREKWETINEFLCKKFKNVIKFDTICNATSTRQKEAEEIAKTVDLMLVIGGNKSSNTQKLYEICKKHCERTYKIENASGIPPLEIKKIKKIGVTAGASTPDWIIKEVIEKMEELNKQENEMSFREAYESSLVTLQTGEIVKGKIIGFNNAEVYVDMGYKSDGIIPMDQFSDDPNFKPEESIKIGDEVEVFVVRVNDGDGNVLLSKKKVDAMKGWDKIEEAYEKKLPIKAVVTDVVNGGVMAKSESVRIFVPASQISDRYVKDLSEFLKQTVNVRIVELNRQKKRVVGSQRQLLEEEKARLEKEFWENIEVGKKYSGVVKSLTDFGAFVDIGGVDGLIHISELSWLKIKHPSEVLKVGDKVEVNVLEFDREKKKVSLGYKKMEDNPWYHAEQKYKVGDIVKVKVVRLVPFGAFVELEEGIDGLVHISQISNVRIGKPGDVLEIGQVVEAKILEANFETKKIGLSIKEVMPIDPPSAQKKNSQTQEQGGEELPSEHKEDIDVKIGDLLGDLKVEKTED